MSFFRQITQKSWLSSPGGVDDLHEGGTFAVPTAKLGLRVFLGVATVLFSLSIIAYADRMVFADWRPLSEPWLLWLNTAVLILSSIALQWALVSAQRRQMDGVRNGLYAGGFFAVAFLAGQLLAWQQLIALNYIPSAGAAYAFFYLLTAFHGLHLLGGLVALGRTTAKMRRGVEPARLAVSVELCAIYWHFLLLIWLVLFALLLFT